MNTTLTQEQKTKFISKALYTYYKSTPVTQVPHKTIYLLYKDYSYITEDYYGKDLHKISRIYSQGDLKDIIEPNKPMYGIITTNKQYMQHLKNNGFTLIYTHQKTINE